MITLKAKHDNGIISLSGAGVGLWQPRLTASEGATPGGELGWLTVLGREVSVRAPADAAGRVTQIAPAGPVDWASVLVELDPRQADAGLTAVTAEEESSGLVFRAPMGGRFYARPAPDKPLFVEVGTELSAGSTVCLLEVMKTFNRVTYGAGLPPARVVRVVPADGDDVAAKDPLVELEAL